MNPSKLKKHLEENFKVLEFVDLNEVARAPSLGFKIFKDQYKPSFDINERIVFYANGHVGTRTLKFLQYAADTFDISRCFVLVCCPSHTIVESPYNIEFFKTQVESKIFEDHRVISVDSLCVMPHMNVEYFNNGSIKTCCYITDVLKSANESGSAKELFFSEKMNRLRKSLLNGEKPSSCQVCWSEESNNLGSLRQWRIKAHRDEFLTYLIDNPQIRSFSMRVSTICNFKCRICSPNASSLWAEESLKHETDESTVKHLRKIIDTSQWFDQNHDMVEDIKNICKDLDFIDIYGGEPLLIKQFKTLLEHCVSLGSAKHQRLHFNTNVSVFPEETFNLMDHFQEIHISLSIDDIGKRFELERGGNWEQIEKNVDRFLALDPNRYKVSIQATVSNLNLLYLDQLVEWAEKKHLPYTLQILESPVVYKYTQVSQKVIDLAVKKYLNHNNSFLRSIAIALQDTPAIDTTEWVQITQTLDQRRDQSIKHSHPELASAMGYV